MESSGSSLSVIVPTAVASSSPAPDGLLRTTVNPSRTSGMESSKVDTEIVWVVSPTAKVSVPESAE